MDKKKSEQTLEETEYSKPSATIEELFQTCPKCNGDLLVKFQSEDKLSYKCDGCGYTEDRNKGKVVTSEESSNNKVKKKKK